jgi:hypothetical protein
VRRSQLLLRSRVGLTYGSEGTHPTGADWGLQPLSLGKIQFVLEDLPKGVELLRQRFHRPPFRFVEIFGRREQLEQSLPDARAV